MMRKADMTKNISTPTHPGVNEMVGVLRFPAEMEQDDHHGGDEADDVQPPDVRRLAAELLRFGFGGGRKRCGEVGLLDHAHI
jgi:hypothetical protein